MLFVGEFNVSFIFSNLFVYLINPTIAFPSTRKVKETLRSSSKQPIITSNKINQDSFPVCSTLLQLVWSVGCIRKGYELLDLIGKSTHFIFSRTREVAKGKLYRVRGLLQEGSSSPRWTLGITALALSSKGLDLLPNSQSTHALNYSLIILKLTNETTAILTRHKNTPPLQALHIHRH